MCNRLLTLISLILMLVLSTGVNGQGIMREVWTGIGGVQVDDLTSQADYPDNPTFGEIMPTFEAPTDFDDNFGSRLHGWLVPATSGDYTFWIAADDGCQLWLSTDDDPANAVEIAGHNSWTSSRQWDKFDSQKSAPVPLVGGTRYYVSALYKEGGGGDNLAVAWEGPDSPTMSVVDGAFLEPAPWAEALKKAGGPVPADGAVDADVTALEWTLGPTSDAANVYLSTDDAIDDADLIAENNTLGIAVATLDPGTTYYWRVDGIEADGAVITGDVWTFTTLPLEAHFPSPADGAVNVISAQLSWTAGKNAIMHNVHFGEDPAALMPVSMMQMETTYDAGMLEDGKTFYWRVDEFTPMGTVTGPVWSFTSPPVIEVTDPNLVGSWTFEEGEGMTVVDFSGNKNHGLISGAANQQRVAGVEVPWMPGLSTSAMEFMGDDQGFVELPADIITAAKGTIMMWINTDQGGPSNNDEGMLFYAGNGGGDGYGGQNEIHLNIDDPGSGQVDFFIEDDPSGGDETVSYNNIGGTGWRHVAASWDLDDGLRLYVDGVEVDTDNHNGATYGFETIRLGRPVGTGNGNRFYEGIMDEVMLYDYALSADQIAPMGRDVLLPYGPSPSDGASNQPQGVTLSWNAGDGAVEQEVYLGTDLDAVTAADATDTTGIYLGRQAETSVAVTLEWGADHYWRVDQVAADGSIVTGPVWAISAAESVVIDLSTDTLEYDHTVEPYVSELVWDMEPHATDWTINGVLDLSMRFRSGSPNPVPGSSTFDAATGTYEITSAGNDIWGSADQFQYVYRTLTGDGSMTARVVDNGTGSNSWAKGGVMIRQDLTGGSKNVMGAITGGSGDGGTFQWRESPDSSSGSSRTLTGIAPPYWVRLTRTGNDFTCELSPDGVTWELEGENPHTVEMTDPVYIGLAVTSHESGEARTFTFDNVSTTGDVTGEENSISVGANDAGPLSVAVEDAAGNVGVTVHPNAGAVQLADWTDWKIPVSVFADQGVDPTAVARLTVSVGDGTRDGTGELDVDNIEVVMPAGNLMVNGGLEDGDTNGWNTYGDATMEIVHDLNNAVVPEPLVEGIHALHVTVNSAGANFWDAGLQNGGKVFEAGKSYSLSIWFKSKSGPFQINMKPERAESPWEGYGSKAITITEEWAQYTTNTGVIAETVDPASITFHIAYAPGEFYVDDAVFIEDR